MIMNGQVLSGTENFTVQGGNRFELSSKTQAEISARTTRLSNEGRIVVSVNTSVPRGISFGVTLWENDVNIVWNATPESIYNKAKAYYTNGFYEIAAKLFKELPGYLDSQVLAKECNSKIREQYQRQKVAEERRAKAEADLVNSIGKEPHVIMALVGGIIVVTGFSLFCGGAFSAGGPAENLGCFLGGLVAMIIGAVLVVIYKLRTDSYNKRLINYNRETEKITKI